MFCFLQTGWTIAVDVVIGPKDGISYRAERGSLVSTCTCTFACALNRTVIKEISFDTIQMLQS